MTISRRKVLSLIGGGVILSAISFTGYTVSRMPKTAQLPWTDAGKYSEPRRRALSYALLAPNPHNRQPWKVDLSRDNEITLYADTERLLPETDPFDRQITIGLGCFLELLRMAAAQDGYLVQQTLFPEGQKGSGLDQRPIAHLRFVRDKLVKADPLFAYVLERRSLKEPFDISSPVMPSILDKLRASVNAGTKFGGSVRPTDIAYFRELSHRAMQIEIETPRTYQESVDLFRIGHTEVDANPDGIDFTGPMFESLHLAGLFNRELAIDPSSSAYKAGLNALYATIDTAMGHIWLISKTNTRKDQIAAGADWLRLNLSAAMLGLGIQPLSQALQEYAEMSEIYRKIHGRLAPEGGTVQMFARIGYGPKVDPSPRWPLEAKIG